MATVVVVSVVIGVVVAVVTTASLVVEVADKLSYLGSGNLAFSYLN